MNENTLKGKECQFAVSLVVSHLFTIHPHELKIKNKISGFFWK